MSSTLRGKPKRAKLEESTMNRPRADSRARYLLLWNIIQQRKTYEDADEDADEHEE